MNKRLFTKAVFWRVFASRVAGQIRLVVLDVVGKGRSSSSTANGVSQPSILLHILASYCNRKRYIRIPDAETSHDTV